MSVLSKEERDGLDDVFLSIHSNHNKYKKIKDLSSLIMSRNLDFSMHGLIQRAKVRLNKVKLSHLLTYLHEKKKNLSK